MAALAYPDDSYPSALPFTARVIYASDISYLEQRCSSPLPLRFALTPLLSFGAAAKSLDMNRRDRLTVQHTSERNSMTILRCRGIGHQLDSSPPFLMQEPRGKVPPQRIDARS